MTIQKDLIYDIGMHSGIDTEFYLKKGFRVVAIEANPLLVATAKSQFSWAIERNLLYIEEFGIFNEESVLDFYVNEECDEWSSFQRHLGTRQNTRFSIWPVSCKKLEYFVQKYGMPYYLKIDVEGVDHLVVRDLALMTSRPAFISVEDGGFDTLIALYEAGVRHFQFVNQLEIREYILPTPPLEGKAVAHRFGVASSGPFGLELPAEWLPTEAAFKYYLEYVRPPGQQPINGWWDIHGRF